MRSLIRFLHTTPAGGVSDAELLRRYAATRDEAAFELLVRRHAAAVWAACRRVLRGDAHAAEDAFQAAFLALARKPGAVRTGCVGGWLYRVAVHAALKLRRAGGVSPPSSGHARGADAPRSDDPAHLTAAAEQAAVVHEELARVAEKHRLPVVLCDLSGLSHAEAAAQLGWPVGTVSGRLVRGRDELRRRLERRGVTLPAAAVAAVLTSESGIASPHLIRAAVAAAGGAATPHVLSLTAGVLQTMRVTNLKLAAVAVCVAAALTGAGVLVSRSQERRTAGHPVATPLTGSETGPPAKDWDPIGSASTAFPDIKPADLDDLPKSCPLLAGDPLVIREADPVEVKLVKAKLNLLRLEIRTGRQASQMRRQPLDRTLQLAREMVTTVVPSSGDRVRWLREFVAVAKACERKAEEFTRDIPSAQPDVLGIRRQRVDAELELYRAMSGTDQRLGR